MEEIEEVSEGAAECDCLGGAVVGGHASGTADMRQVEIERIDEERDETGYEEEVVPPVDDIPAGVEDLIPP